MTPHSLFLIDPFGWMILDTGLKATVMIAVGTGLVWLFARSSAALRHRIWALLFIALLLLPALGLAVPRWDWRIVPRGWQVAATTVREASPGTTTESPLKTPSGPIASAPTTGASVAEASGTGTPGMAVTTTATVANNTQPIVSPTQSDDAVTAARLARVPAKNSDLGEGRAAAPFGSARPPGHWLAIAWLGGAFLALLPLALGLL